MRAHFVKHEGKEKIELQRPGFVKGCSSNDWPGVFPEFSQKIASHVGAKTCDLLQCSFSTTTAVTKIASQIALMDTMKHYFDYDFFGGCGIPSVELTGTLGDWETLRAKASEMEAFGLGWWTEHLLPVLDQFVAAAGGKPDIKFWKSVCNLYGGSGCGCTPVTGWVQTFFPYLERGHRNGSLGQWKESYHNNTVDDYRVDNGILCWEQPGQAGFDCGQGVDLKDFPCSISHAPFTYSDEPSGNKFDMVFAGGLVAVTQDPHSLAVEPVAGWAVLELGELKA